MCIQKIEDGKFAVDIEVAIDQSARFIDVSHDKLKRLHSNLPEVIRSLMEERPYNRADLMFVDAEVRHRELTHPIYNLIKAEADKVRRQQPDLPRD